MDINYVHIQLHVHITIGSYVSTVHRVLSSKVATLSFSKRFLDQKYIYITNWWNNLSQTLIKSALFTVFSCQLYNYLL